MEGLWSMIDEPKHDAVTADVPTERAPARDLDVGSSVGPYKLLQLRDVDLRLECRVGLIQDAENPVIVKRRAPVVEVHREAAVAEYYGGLTRSGRRNKPRSGPKGHGRGHNRPIWSSEHSMVQ